MSDVSQYKIDIPKDIKNFPQYIKDAIDINNSMIELYDKKDYYENLDWVEVSEQLDRLYEYRDKLFLILKKAQSLETSDVSFEWVRNTTINLIKRQ